MDGTSSSFPQELVPLISPDLTPDVYEDDESIESRVSVSCSWELTFWLSERSKIHLIRIILHREGRICNQNSNPKATLFSNTFSLGQGSKI